MTTGKNRVMKKRKKEEKSHLQSHLFNKQRKRKSEEKDTKVEKIWWDRKQLRWLIWLIETGQTLDTSGSSSFKKFQVCLQDWPIFRNSGSVGYNKSYRREVQNHEDINGRVVKGFPSFWWDKFWTSCILVTLIMRSLRRMLEATLGSCRLSMTTSSHFLASSI